MALLPPRNEIAVVTFRWFSTLPQQDYPVLGSIVPAGEPRDALSSPLGCMDAGRRVQQADGAETRGALRQDQDCRPGHSLQVEGRQDLRPDSGAALRR